MERIYFYTKENRKIAPVTDKELNNQAKAILDKILETSRHLIPEEFIENWSEVSLFHPRGDLKKANQILINPERGSYSLDNKLNDLTGKDWTKFTCSWFVFNALHSDLRAEKELDPDNEHHPATFSPTMISDFIRFFTKKGSKVLDPFVGIGSTLEACRRTGRIGYGIELNRKYFELAIKRDPEFMENIFNTDAARVLDLNLPQMDFCISSPPYWDILNRSTHTYEETRRRKEFDVKYSDSVEDLGNVADYELFLKKTADIYLKIYEVLRKGAYIVVIIKNVKKGGRMYPLAWDLAKILSEKYVLKDEKIWIQDKVSLAPYGYPFSWASNIIHHYCLILRKEQ
jgi:DNA modification methylase